MELTQARKTGRRIAVKVWIVAILIIELILFVISVRGDFANGILFFISEQVNLNTAILIGILCLTAFLLGGIAGKGILIKRWNYLVIAVIYTVFTIIIILLCLIGVIVARSWGIFQGGHVAFVPITMEYALTPLVIMILYIAVVWLLITSKIKSMAVTDNK